jgi:hypothetical protein
MWSGNGVARAESGNRDEDKNWMTGLGTRIEIEICLLPITGYEVRLPTDKCQT